MTTNLSGLFGNTTRTPQEYRQEVVNGMLAQDARRGSQSVDQSAIDLAGDMGANLGSGLGQLFGGKTAEQIRDSNINDALKKVSEGGYDSEYAKMEALSKELGNMGMGAEAQQALDRANQLQLNDLNIQKAKKGMQPEQFKDFYYTDNVVDPMTNEVKQVQRRETREWNEKLGKYVSSHEQVNGTGGQGGQGGIPGLGITQEGLDAQAAKRAAAAANGGGGQRGSPSQQPTPRNLPPTPNLTEAERLQQQYYEQQQQAGQGQREEDQYNKQEIRRLQNRSAPQFNSLAEKEAAMVEARRAGNTGLFRIISQSPPYRQN